MTTPTRAEIEAYRRDGAVCLRGVFSPEWLDLLAAGVERKEGAPASGAPMDSEAFPIVWRHAR